MTLVSLMYFDICISISHLRLNSKYTNQLSPFYLLWAQTANLMSLSFYQPPITHSLFDFFLQNNSRNSINSHYHIFYFIYIKSKMYFENSGQISGNANEKFNINLS